MVQLIYCLRCILFHTQLVISSAAKPGDQCVRTETTAFPSETTEGTTTEKTTTETIEGKEGNGEFVTHSNLFSLSSSKNNLRHLFVANLSLQ